jgi:hypothetical protein
MSIQKFITETSNILNQKYSLGLTTELDLQADLLKEECLIRTEICDRLADHLKISPASIAHGLVQELNLKNIEATADARGYLYLPIGEEELPSSLPKGNPDKLEIYIQPPLNGIFDFAYLRFISQCLLQFKLLLELKIEFKVFVPDHSGMQVLVPKQEHPEAFILTVLKVLKDSKVKPHLDQISNFLDKAELNDSVVLWLSVEILSLEKVSTALSKIKSRVSLSNFLSIRSERIEQERGIDLYEEFFASYCEYGLLACVHVISAKNITEIDWSATTLDNWLNLKYICQKFHERASQRMPINEKVTAREVGNQDSYFKFLMNCFELSFFRAAISGAAEDLLKSTHALASNGHKLLNLRYNLEFVQNHKCYSLFQNLFSIIK